MEAACPVLPNSETVRAEQLRRSAVDLRHSLRTDPLDEALIERVFDRFTAEEKWQISANVIFLLLDHLVSSKCGRENVFELLRLFPNSARMCDSHGKFLLHHVLHSDEVDCEIAFRLVIVAPEVILRTVPSVSGGAMNCLHLALSKSEVDFKLVFLMVSRCPAASKVCMDGGKTPLHQLIGREEHSAYHDEFFLATMKKLLVSYPQAAFQEIKEEKLLMRFTPPALPSLVTATATVEAHSFTLQRVSVKWAPIDKARSSLDPQIRVVFERFVEAVAMQRLRSQWQPR